MDGRLETGSILSIRYRDRDGELTARTIRVLEDYFSGNGVEYVRAYCFLRDEERTFRRDGIIALQGETVPPEPVSFHNTPQAPCLRPAASPLTPAGRDGGLPSQNSVTPASHDKAGKGESSPVPARKGGGIWWGVLAVAAFVVITRGQDLFPSVEAPTIHDYARSFKLAVEEKPAAKKDSRARSRGVSVRPAPAFVAEKVLKTVDYNGSQIQLLRSARGLSYRVLPAWLSFPSIRAAHDYVNIRRYVSLTGLRDKRLLALYAGADADGDGGLDWAEMSRFQEKLHGSYSYIHNSTALRPDQFLNAGGGDCEDWAILSCGLCRYWGIQAFVGVLSSPDDPASHAVCLVYQDERPLGVEAYVFKTGWYTGGAFLRSGYYVPVDYAVVGGFSTAVGPGWKLTYVYVPEAMYGKYF